METFTIRDAKPEDFDRIIAINAAFEHFTAPMGEEKLTHLDNESCYHRVVEHDGDVVAFLIAMAPAADYKSPNFLWFRDNYDSFVYIDRIVIDEAHHRMGLGQLLYDDLFHFARENNYDSVTCEYYTKPENAVSALFHQRFGFFGSGHAIP